MRSCTLTQSTSSAAAADRSPAHTHATRASCVPARRRTNEQRGSWPRRGARRTTVTPVAALPEFADLARAVSELASRVQANSATLPSLADVAATQAAVDASATVAAAAEYMRTLWSTASPAQDAGAVAAAAGASAGGLAVSRGGGGGASAAKLPTTWDVEAIRRYWSTRPLAASRRSSALVSKLLTWMSALLLDVQRGDDTVQRNAPARARALRELIVVQGPAFVKVGQAVAIRPDLLPPAYLDEFATLLDQVAPFSSQEARALIEAETGRSLAELFDDVAAFDSPVAAASIGQVYKASLRGRDGAPSTPVAVKVQRPDILDNITLDLVTLRAFAAFFAALQGESDSVKQIRQNAQGFVAILDVAAERFLEELDYRQEASNGARFEQLMGEVESIRGVLKVPSVFLDVSSRYIIVQEWVDGVKLTQLQTDTTADGARLRGEVVRKLLNSYMVQLLETGFLHADPHPGNFLYLPDGRLCILDFGMMTEITQEQRTAFVEYLAHLNAGQYDRTLTDLVNLGFIPEELYADPAKRAIVAPVIAQTLEALYATGGGMDVKAEALQAQAQGQTAALKAELDALAKQYPIQLPPYFVLILRAFGTLEGLGLSTEGDFAIVDECFPYIARRLLSDDSPRMRAALRCFLYSGGERINVQKVEELAAGFGTFTNAMDAATVVKPNLSTSTSTSSTALATTTPSPPRPALDAGSRDLLQLLFSAEGNYVQELLIDEAVRAADALSRDAAVNLYRSLAAAAPALAVASLLPPLPFAPPLMLLPGLNAVPLLALLAARSPDAVQMTADDKANLEVLQGLARLLVAASSAASSASASSSSSSASSAPPSAEQLRSSATEAAAVAAVVAPGAQRMAARFVQLTAARLQKRAADDWAAAGLGVGLFPTSAPASTAAAPLAATRAMRR